MFIKKITSFFKYLKDFFIGIYIKSKDIKEIFRLIYKFYYWKSSESNSFSGAGSELKATNNIRQELALFMERENIKTILDVPCGDFFWMSKIDLKNINYTGGDIVKEIIFRNNQEYKKDNLKFIIFDIMKDNLEKNDLIINRDCLVHFTNKEIFESLNNIKNSRCNFLEVQFLEKYNNFKKQFTR